MRRRSFVAIATLAPMCPQSPTSFHGGAWAAEPPVKSQRGEGKQMNTDAALDAWLGHLSSIGFAASYFLNPPAPEDALTAAEAELGFDIPSDLRHLWRHANGQQDIFKVTDPSPGIIVCPLFGTYWFSSVSRALLDYKGWLAIYNECDRDEFDEAYNGVIKRRGTDPVFREYWRPGWLPFSLDGGGNSYAVDCSPAPGGTYGQVIVIGADEDLRRVLAPNLSAFLANAVGRRPSVRAPLPGKLWATFDMEERRS